MVLTAVFACTASYAAAIFTTSAQWVGAATAMVLFTVGVVAFLWAYWSAVQRSRTADISVTQLFLLLGEVIPSPIRRIMNSLLATQVTVAIVTTLARPDGPHGGPGSSLAVGFLVPMLGFGLNGLWAANNGTFTTRHDFPVSAPPIGQNEDHD